VRKDTLPPCAADALRRVRQVTINGHPVGIMKLDFVYCHGESAGAPGRRGDYGRAAEGGENLQRHPSAGRGRSTHGCFSKNTGKLHGRSPGSALRRDPLIPGEPEFRHAPAFLRGSRSPFAKVASLLAVISPFRDFPATIPATRWISFYMSRNHLIWFTCDRDPDRKSGRETGTFSPQ